MFLENLQSASHLADRQNQEKGVDSLDRRLSRLAWRSLFAEQPWLLQWFAALFVLS